MATFICTGRLGKDAELKTLSNGTEVCSWSMAYDTGYGDKKKSHWVKCAIFGKRATKLAEMLSKGSLVEVVGEPVVGVWADKTTKEPRGQIELSVMEVKLHGGGNRDDKPVADRGRATRGDDMYQDDVPF
jgi:single-strand DNA-binding protein